MFADRIVPIHLLLVDEHGHGRRGEGFGHGTGAEVRVRRDGLGSAVDLRPVAFEKDHAVVLDHDDRRSGDLPRFHGLGHHAIEGGGIGLGGVEGGGEGEEGQ